MLYQNVIFARIIYFFKYLYIHFGLGSNILSCFECWSKFLLRGATFQTIENVGETYVGSNIFKNPKMLGINVVLGSNISNCLNCWSWIYISGATFSTFSKGWSKMLRWWAFFVFSYRSYFLIFGSNIFKVFNFLEQNVALGSNISHFRNVGAKFRFLGEIF